MTKFHGFTLLEVIVALAILAITLSAIIKTTAENAENVRYLRDRTLAHWVAMNVLTDIRVRKEWSPLGKREGTAMMANREWFWILHTENTLDEELRRVTIEVRSTPTMQEPLAVLVGFISLESNAVLSKEPLHDTNE